MDTFLITGVQRSGTTLLSFLLANHSEVHLDTYSLAFRIVNCLDTNFHYVLPTHLDSPQEEILQALIQNDYKGRLANFLDHENIGQHPSIRDFLSDSIRQQLNKEQKKIWGNKAPNFQLYLPQLLLLMPNCKIIHIVRDGRATACSMHQRAHKNLRLSAQDWVDGNIMALHHQALLGKERFLIIRYEDLLQKTAVTLQAICRFLDIPFEAAMTNLKQNKDLGHENFYVQASLDAKKINSYQDKLSNKQIRQIERIQGPLLQKLGYSLLQERQISTFGQLSTFQRIWLNQRTNFAAIFRAKDTRMENWEVKTVHIPLRKRLGFFLRMLAYNLLALPIFKAIFWTNPKQLLQSKEIEKK